MLRTYENVPVNVRNPDNVVPVKTFKPETNALRREILALQQALKVAKQETQEARHQSKQLDAELATMQTVQTTTYRDEYLWMSTTLHMFSFVSGQRLKFQSDVQKMNKGDPMTPSGPAVHSNTALVHHFFQQYYFL
jgi:hypothetical protein